jgi:hypothetical protein
MKNETGKCGREEEIYINENLRNIGRFASRKKDRLLPNKMKHSEICDIRHWTIRKAPSNGKRLRSLLHFTSPGTGSTLVNMKIKRVKY